MNTLENPQRLTPRIIYNYDRRTNESWNMPQYKVPRQYLDPALQVKQRQWASQKKGQKDRKHITKKGFYMDYELKVASTIPGSNKHGDNKPWSFQKLLALSKHRKVDKNLIKRSFLDQIQIQQKNRKKPGIGTYSLQKSQKQKDLQIQQAKKKKYFVGEKHFYHDDISFLGDKSPGSGNYNPHDEINKIRFNKTDYKLWIKKHKDEDEKHLKRDQKLPAPGTYTPMNCTFTTFDLIEKQQKNSKSKSKQKSNGFGTDARFEYTRPDKKKIKEKRPDPISYNTMYEWRDKKSSPKSKPWNQSISKGYQTLSVYH